MRFFVDTPIPVHSPTEMLQVLLLEDDPLDCELIGAALKNGGIKSEIIRVTDRQGFLERLDIALPDIILADYVLPRFDGLAALEVAQENCPDVPFILVSGVLGEEQAIDAFKHGATDYVLKQRLDRLVPAVQRAVRESQGRQERQRVTRALKQTDDLLSAIIDASPVSIITLSREQRVMTWNVTAEKLYGWEAKAIIDCPLPLIPESQQSVFNQYLADVLQDKVVFNQEIQHQRLDGTLFDVLLSLAPLHDENDNICGIVMTTVDHSLHKRVEAQRLALLEQERAARAAAESANRIKDEFLAVLSHELRTPLNAIVGWIKLIQEGGLSASMLEKALNTIERNADAQARLIEDLLDISRITRGEARIQLQSVDVNNLILATVESLRPAAAAKSIQIELLSKSLGPILADASRLQQVIWNLLSNAIKFTQATGTITVRCQPIDAYLQIQVEDSGIGIAPEFLDHVFEYFRQADGSIKRAQGGLGLGLAITRHLVELHGGTLQAASPGLGQGSTFTVLLPIRRPAEVEHELGQKPGLNSPNLSGIKAIVVDDDDDARTLMTFVLEQQGAKVESADNVPDALLLLKHFQPDVLISDIGMPNIDGYTLLKKLRTLPNHRLRNIPAIALTAYASEEDRQRALSVGFQTHLSKPVDPLDMVTTVYQLAQQ